MKHSNACPMGGAKHILISLPSAHPLHFLFLSCYPNYWFIFLLHFMLHILHLSRAFLIPIPLSIPCYLTETLSFVKLSLPRSWPNPHIFFLIILLDFLLSLTLKASGFPSPVPWHHRCYPGPFNCNLGSTPNSLTINVCRKWQRIVGEKHSC